TVDRFYNSFCHVCLFAHPSLPRLSSRQPTFRVVQMAASSSSSSSRGAMGELGELVSPTLGRSVGTPQPFVPFSLCSSFAAQTLLARSIGHDVPLYYKYAGMICE